MAPAAHATVLATHTAVLNAHVAATAAHSANMLRSLPTTSQSLPPTWWSLPPTWQSLPPQRSHGCPHHSPCRPRLGPCRPRFGHGHVHCAYVRSPATRIQRVGGRVLAGVTTQLLFPITSLQWVQYIICAPEAHIMYLTVSSSFLISFVMGGERPEQGD